MIKKTKHYVIAATLIGMTSIFYYFADNYGHNSDNAAIGSNNALNQTIEISNQTVVEVNDYLARGHFSYIPQFEEIKSPVQQDEKDIPVINLAANTISLGTQIQIAQRNTENISRSNQAVQREESQVQPQPQPQEQVQTEPQNPPQVNQGLNEEYLSKGLNNYVLEEIKAYDTSQNYPYLLNTDYANYNGVTSNIIFQGKTLLKAHPSGIRYSHCTGITFEVFFKAMEKRNRLAGLDSQDFNGMTYNDLYSFMLKWYVAGPKQSNNLAAAVESYGIGRRITNFEEAQPGDFIDISRENNTGHTAVFLGWIREEGKIIGLRYWSSQQSTKGINYNTEYFNVGGKNSSKYGNVMINNVYIARVSPINQYRSFR